jgi:hypothetical protein
MEEYPEEIRAILREPDYADRLEITIILLQDLMRHLSPYVCTILGSRARLYNNEHDWVGSTFRWFDLCQCYTEVVDGLDRDGLGPRLSV